MAFDTARSSVSAVEDYNRLFLRNVFAWMFLGLGITTAVAIYVSSTSDVSNYVDEHGSAMFVLFAVQLGIALGFGFLLPRISAAVAAVLFCVYALTIGLTFALILEVYTTASVVGAFAGATGLFAGMAVYGYTTKRDLSVYRGILIGAVWGIVIASVAFVFVGGSAFNLIIGWAGVLVFSVLVAYQLQALKAAAASGFQDGQTAEKVAIYGAFSLYVAFINLFISLLRIFGSSR